MNMASMSLPSLLALLLLCPIPASSQQQHGEAQAAHEAELDERLFAAHEAATSADDAAIDALFASGHCKHAYIDVGTNVGVQIRKLYEPHLYPGAPIHTKFDRVFGPATDGARCGVCAIGVEPNPHHRERLSKLQRYLRHQLGVRMLVLRAAASDADSVTTLAMPAAEKADGNNDWSASNNFPFRGMKRPKASLSYLALRGAATVRTVDVARIVMRVRAHLSRRSGAAGAASSVGSSSRASSGRIFSKIDCEGCEFHVLPHLVLGHGLCAIDEMEIEWHGNYLSYAPFLEASAKHLGLPARASGAAAVGDFIGHLSEWFEQRRANTTALHRHPWAASCMLRNISAADDETYVRDQPGWPGVRLCPRVPSTGEASRRSRR